MDMMNDTTGHSGLMGDGFDYHHFNTPEYESQRTAQRAAFAAYQSYPANEVEGMATLVRGAPGFYPGKYWTVTQPAQVAVNQYQIMADMLGGGVDAGNLVLQPLVTG